MPKTYRLWSLNAVTKHFASGGPWRFTVPAPTNTVTMVPASRTPAFNLPDDDLGVRTTPSQLMHEGTRVNEYWVPIAVKCIGDPTHARAAWVDTGNAARNALFDGIAQHYQAQFANVGGAWQGLPWDGQRRMGTSNRRGLYDLLQESTPAGELNILVGYSQGGLVARYLAMLDEHVSKRPVIAGFITVHSPNAGSVFGSPRNADRTLAGLLSLVFCGARVDAALLDVFHDKLFSLMPAGGGAAFLTYLTQAAEAGLADFRTAYDAAERTVATRYPANDPRRQERIFNDRTLANMRAKSEVLVMVHRWLSGLRGDDRYAFADFDPKGLDDDFSVLGSLYDHPLDRILHAALVGWDFSPSGLIFPGILESADNFFPKLREISFDMEQQAKRLMREGGSLGTVASLFSALMENGVAGVTAEQLKVFRGAPLRSGLPDWRRGMIPPYAHDFIVPAAYQLIHAHEADGLIGNFVFDDETHADGVDDCAVPLRNLLGVMARRLA